MVALEFPMLRSIALPVILSLAFAAQANDTGEISLRSKALASASSSALSASLSPPSFSAPAASSPRHGDTLPASGHDPLPQLLLLDEQDEAGPRKACETTSKDLCYDLAQQRIVYRAAREYMPSVAGLSPEGVSVRHNRVVLTYSFK
jgi:hypothetical protein